MALFHSVSDIHVKSRNTEKFSLKICFMDYDKTDVLRTSQERQAADVTLGRF